MIYGIYKIEKGHIITACKRYHHWLLLQAVERGGNIELSPPPPQKTTREERTYNKQAWCACVGEKKAPPASSWPTSSSRIGIIYPGNNETTTPQYGVSVLCTLCTGSEHVSEHVSFPPNMRYRKEDSNTSRNTLFRQANTTSVRRIRRERRFKMMYPRYSYLQSSI